MDDLIERLRKRANTYTWDSATFYISDAETMRQAADEIERLTAEVERRKYDGIHTCHDQCQREACVLRREVDALRAELKATETKSVKLWTLLDDIDTLDDACRGEDDLFRTLTRSLQRKRFEIMSGKEWDAEVAAIVAWIRNKAIRAWGADATGRDETQFIADAIERGEYKPTLAMSDLNAADLVCGTLGDSDGDDGA